MPIRLHAPLALGLLAGSLASGCWLEGEPMNEDEPEHEPGLEDDAPPVPSQPLPLEGSPTAYGMLRVVNELRFSALDDDVGLDRQAAASILAYRSGSDELLGTADDRHVEDLAELDALYWLGPENLWRIQAYALAEGWVPQRVTEGCDPALAEALERCRAFIVDAAMELGSTSAAMDASWSCVEAGDAEVSAAGYFAQAGLAAYREPALGYHAMLCNETIAPICELGVAGIATHGLPECVASGG